MYKKGEFTNLACFVSGNSFSGVDLNKPQIGLWGRSNVGKSSLINSLTNRKSLVRVSKTPGCTRKVNFFKIGSLLYLVDLPGYGYAKASKHDVDAWVKHTKDYLCSNDKLSKLFLLIDSKVGLKSADLHIIQFLDANKISYQFVLTKIDKLEKCKLDPKMVAHECVNSSRYASTEVLMVSIRESKSIDQLRNSIVRFVGL